MGTKNKNWVIHYKENATLAQRFDDQIENHLRTHRIILTPFLDETQQRVLMSVAGNRVNLSFFGGYEHAERKRALLSEYDDDFEIVQLKAKLSGYDKIKHSDCMGALYNIGCKSEQFGDILVDHDCVRVFVSKNIASFVINNCTMIRHSRVTFCEDDSEVVVNRHMKVMRKIVSSVRLDSLVAACTNLSRAKAQNLIRAKNVKVNHICLEETSYLCNNDSILSIRGYGRFVYLSTIKETRNNKFVVEIGIYQ